MADLVSKVLEELISIAAREIKQEVTLVVGVKKEVEKLTSNFDDIKAVLDDAEERQFKEATVKRWLDKLKDVSYDMDDVMDEWSTAIQKSQEVDEHPPKPMTKRKVCSFISSSCFRCGEVSLRHDIAHKIKKLNERLDDIAKEKDRYNLKLFIGKEQPERHITTSIIDESEVVGKQQDKNAVLNLLLSESSQGSSLRIVSIVGMGGIGKTTLAKIVYNDNEVEARFEVRIWVCVSDPFDEMRIAKAILEGLKNEAPNVNELQTLLQNIQQSIRGKKFLLVLDDVWTEESGKWEQLINSLKCGSLGSTILVTTRSENVASCMGSTNIFPLALLSIEECWSLFSQIAFFGRTSSACQTLEDIGRKIVNKCKGLPLAVKTLGSLLRFKKSREQWKSVLDSDLWELKEAEKDVFGPLLLSYNDLPSEMRSCFSYCAMFPKDYEWARDDLIKFWMAQGYLRSSQSIELEMIGKEYFENLAARSLFQDFVKDEDDGGIIRCKMHDIVHDFAQYVTKNECSIEFNGLKKPRMGSSSKVPRHSMIVLPDEDQFVMSSHHFKKLRSLVVVVEFRSVGAILPELFSKLTSLRMLNLSHCYIEVVPPSIGKLIHLRYINLSWNWIKELPETICELYNLQTLDVTNCGIYHLPCGIGKLVNLRHLYIRRRGGGVFMLEGIKRLSSLRTLDVFVVNGGGGPDGEASNLGDLENLNNLRGDIRIIHLENVRNPDDARQANLKSKIHLNSLGLDFRASSRTEKGVVCDDEVIEALEPSPNLEKLDISSSRSMTRFPNWITSLSKLKRIRLRSCDNIMYLPPLGKLLCLEVIEVVWMTGVKRVGEEFLGIKNDGSRSTKKDKGEMSSSPDINIAFPKLKKLEFLEMEEWEEWGDEEINNKTTNISNIMPSLRSLIIKLCPKLKALPGYLFHLTTLEELTIKYCPILEERFKKGEGEDWHNISHIPNIQIGPSILNAKPESESEADSVSI